MGGDWAGDQRSNGAGPACQPDRLVEPWLHPHRWRLGPFAACPLMEGRGTQVPGSVLAAFCEQAGPEVVIGRHLHRFLGVAWAGLEGRRMVTDDREGIQQATEVMRTRATDSGRGHGDDEIVAVGVDMGAAPAQALLHTLDTAGFYTTVLVVAAVRWEGSEADSAASHKALPTRQWGSRSPRASTSLPVSARSFSAAADAPGSAS